MFVSLRMINAPGMSGEALAELLDEMNECGLAALGAAGCWAAKVSPTAVINAGSIVWRMIFSDEAQAMLATTSAEWRQRIAPRLEGLQMVSIGYRMVDCNVRRTGPGIWRALIFRVMPHAAPETVKRLEMSTSMLAKHVQEIRSWSLSSVAYTEGPKPFSYVWEQEFDRIEDLTGPYMAHPVHWGVADAFFDAECPDYIVDPQLIQVVGAIDQSILTPIPPNRAGL